MNSMKLVILLHFISWKRHQTMLWHHNARVNSHQRWKQTRFRICFHLSCELTLGSSCHSIVWSLFHEIKCNRMTSFMEYTYSRSATGELPGGDLRRSREICQVEWTIRLRWKIRAKKSIDANCDLSIDRADSEENCPNMLSLLNLLPRATPGSHKGQFSAN